MNSVAPVRSLLAALLLSLSSSGGADAAPLSVAAVQYPIEGNHDLPSLTEKVESYVKAASGRGAHVVVFPELLTLDAWPLGDPRSDPAITRWIAQQVTPGFVAALQRLARKHDITIVGGSSPRMVDGRVFNTALVAFPDGSTVTQDKLHLTPWEVASGWSPGTELRPFDAPWGRSVVLICYDAEFPTLSAALLEAKPLVWFVPSMTDSVHGLERVRWSAQARAVEHHAFVVVTGTVGSPSKDFVNVGQAAFLTPRRASFPVDVVEGHRNEASIVLSVLEVDRLLASRAAAKLYPARDALGRTARIHLELVKPR